MDHILIHHRYLGSSRFVREQLHANALSEAATFACFLAITAFDWLQLTLITTAPHADVGLRMIVNSWATFIITVAGVIYLLYAKRRPRWKTVPLPLLPTVSDSRLEVRRGHGCRYMACRFRAFRNKRRGPRVDFKQRSHSTQRRDVWAHRSAPRKPGEPMNERAHSSIAGFAL